MNIEKDPLNPIDPDTVATIMTNITRVEITRSIAKNPNFIPNLIYAIGKDLITENEIASRPILAAYSASALLNAEINEDPEAEISVGIKKGSIAPTVGIVTTELQIMGKVNSIADVTRDPRISFAATVMVKEDERILSADRTGFSLIDRYVQRAKLQQVAGMTEVGFIQGSQLAAEVYKLIYPQTAIFTR